MTIPWHFITFKTIYWVLINRSIDNFSQNKICNSMTIGMGNKFWHFNRITNYRNVSVCVCVCCIPFWKSFVLFAFTCAQIRSLSPIIHQMLPIVWPSNHVLTLRIAMDNLILDKSLFIGFLFIWQNMSFLNEIIPFVVHHQKERMLT